MTRLIFALASISMLCAANPAFAQTPTRPLEVGDHLRLMTVLAPQPREGTLLRLRDDVLRFEWGRFDVVDEIPLGDIRRLERRLERNTRWLALGIAGGAAGGFLFGAAAHQLTNEDTSEIITASVLGAAVGFGLGSLVGKTLSKEVWEILRVQNLNGVRVGGS